MSKRPKTIRLRYVFNPDIEMSVSVKRPTLLPIIVRDTLKDHLAEHKPGGLVEEFHLIADFDNDELRACAERLDGLLDVRRAVDEKSIRQRGEAFVDDFLLISPNLASLFVKDLVTYHQSQAQSND